MPEEVTDEDGVVLGVGDSVESTARYERGYVHAGQIVAINDGFITVRHYRGCCEPGRESASAPNCWRRRKKATAADRTRLESKRPTAWDKILQDD